MAIYHLILMMSRAPVLTQPDTVCTEMQGRHTAAESGSKTAAVAEAVAVTETAMVVVAAVVVAMLKK